MVTVMDKLYKLDTKGKLRVWWVEIDGDKIRNVSGLDDGEKVESGWKLMKAKNTGRSNATTPEQQAIVEAEALYEKQLGKGGYHRNKEDAGKKLYIEPMLAKTYADVLPIDFTLTFSQPKLDGHRCIAKADGLWTRNGKRYISVPHIEFALIPLFKKYPNLILDGELYNHDLRDNFNEISSCVRKTKPTKEDIEQASVIEYHVYDIVDTKMPFSSRFSNLCRIINEYDLDMVKIVPTEIIHDQNSLDNCYDTYIAKGYEGQMVRYNECYEQKRSKNLIKRKEFITEEYTIHDILEGEGNWAGYAKTVRYHLDDERIASAGIKGNQEFTKKLLEEKDEYIGGEITLQYFQKTPDGVPRFPVAIAFYKGKRDT